MDFQLHPKVVGVAAGVLVYSVFCLVCGILLIWLVWIHRQKTSYVGMLAVFTSLSTLASIAQQIGTIVRWRDIKLEQYQNYLANADSPALIFSSPSGSLDAILFTIQYYCYNVETLIIFFWAGALAQSVFQMEAFTSPTLTRKGPLIAKAICILLPVIQVSLLRVSAIRENTAVYFTLTNIIMGFSLTFGSLILLAILIQYIHTRRALLPWNVRYGQQSINKSDHTSTTDITLHSADFPVNRTIYDSWLVVRFSIGFFALSLFEVFIILFEIQTLNQKMRNTASDSPDLSAKRARSDFILFIPGVTISLLTFIIFGTTKTFRDCIWLKFVPRTVRRRLRDFSGTSSGAPPSIAAIANEQQQSHPQLSPLDLESLSSPALEAALQGFPVPTVEAGSPGYGSQRFVRDSGYYVSSVDGSSIKLRDLQPDGRIRRQPNTSDDEWPLKPNPTTMN